MASLTEQDWAGVDAALRGVGSLGQPAEIHGEFCGLACIMGKEALAPWASAVLGDAVSDEADQRVDDATTALVELAEAAWSALEAGDMSFELLLPPDEASLEQRATALGVWCQGFMHGLGAAGRPGSDSPVVSNEVVQEIVADFSEITRATFAEDETEEAGEAAFLELVEYVRVSVQLVFEELHGIRTSSADTIAH